jgi:hypothetical protein
MHTLGLVPVLALLLHLYYTMDPHNRIKNVNCNCLNI